jgi:hypothetical protein
MGERGFDFERGGSLERGTLESDVALSECGFLSERGFE